MPLLSPLLRDDSARLTTRPCEFSSCWGDKCPPQTHNRTHRPVAVDGSFGPTRVLAPTRRHARDGSALWPWRKRGRNGRRETFPRAVGDGGGSPLTVPCQQHRGVKGDGRRSTLRAQKRGVPRDHRLNLGSLSNANIMGKPLKKWIKGPSNQGPIGPPAPPTRYRCPHTVPSLHEGQEPPDLLPHHPPATQALAHGG